MTTVEEFAPAKVNLTLHVTGQRADGYHLLDSLVVFADVGDRITAVSASDMALSVTGPRSAGVPTDGRNLVLKAASLMGGAGARLTLHKVLPAASGIGGGSSDAAATLRALARLWSVDLPTDAAVLALGADVPVCLVPRSLRMTGIGEVLAPVPALPLLPAVLVNPGIEVPTPAVFGALARRDNPAMSLVPASLTSVTDVAAWLRGQRNDLQDAACQIAPLVSATLDTLQGLPECLLARMSGSGATCFGLFPTPAHASAAGDRIRQAHPDWWVAETRLG